MDAADAQKLTDLRQRILENERAGRPAHFNISADDLAAGLAVMRQNRAVASSRGGETTAKARKTKATSGKGVDTAKLKGILEGLD